MKKVKLTGYISSAELNDYMQTPISEEAYRKRSGTPIMLEIWKDGVDFRECANGCHLKKVSVVISEDTK